MNIFINPGHTLKGKGTGAVGFINEGQDNRVMNDLVVEYLKKGGANVDTGRVDESANYLAEQVKMANRKNYDLVVQIHFNSSNLSSANGTEVLYSSNRGKPHAQRTVNSIGKEFRNRGVVLRNDLYWLNKTKAPAILIETCFVSNKSDTDKYKANKRLIAKRIAEGILGKEIREEPSQADIIYQVVVSSNRVRANADNDVERLKKAGFKDAFIQVKK